MGNTKHHQPTLKFVSEQASRIPPSDQAAFIQETVQAPEAVIVERLQVLVRDGASVILRGVLERLPTRKLALILTENHAHRFLSNEAVDTLLEHLSLVEIVELSGVVTHRTDAHASIFGRPALLERVRSTLASVVRDRPLPGLESLLGRPAARLLALAYASSCPVAEQQRLATLLSRLIERGQVRVLASILESVRLPNGTVDLLGDLHLRWLCRHHADLLLKLAADGSQGFCLARRLVTMHASGQDDDEAGPVLGGLSTLLERLDNNQIWDLVCHYVQLHDPRERGRALSTILGQLDARRIAGVISERYSDPEIGVYWPLFPEAVRRELIQLGRGRVWSWDEGKARSSQRFGYSSSSTKGGFRSRRRWRQASRKRAARRGHGPEVVEALNQMVELFGFDESMSFHEAQRLYWRLVMKWHPDRVGNNPVSERKIRDLNRAWDVAKVCFVSNAG